MKTLDAKMLGLYLGCEVQTIHRGYKPEGGKSFRKCGKMMCIDLVLEKVEIWFPEDQKENLTNFEYHEVKPILRRLESMTEGERLELIKTSEHITNEDIISDVELASYAVLYCKKTKRMQHNTVCGILFNALEPSHFQYLLSKSFDLFNLIDSDLALDAATINPKPLLEGEK